MLDSNTSHELTTDHIPNIVPEDTVQLNSEPLPDHDHIIPNEASPLPSLGRTTRSIHPPSYLKDYNCTLPKLNSSISTPNSQHSLTSIISDHNHVCFTTLCSNSQQLIKAISHDCEPSCYEEAILNPAWQMAMTQEFEALYANDTWDLVPLPAGKNAIGCK